MLTHANSYTIISTDRHGGVSHAPYDSLNLSYGVGDDENLVAANRNRLKKQLLITHLLSARQVHGDRIYIASHTLRKDTEIDNYDALVTDMPGIGLLIQQADCQAVTLFDPINHAIAAIHCGWKGSVLNILSKTVNKMTECYDSSPSALQAVISPSLGPCCAEFINHATELPPSFLAFQIKENYFDFWQISKMQLIEAGLDERKIQITGICTSCSPDHFSYRRACRNGDGKTGRCATVICL
ncbi:MAG TPA: peptidoglycan editing factor PgeF [Desulfocapsa sulfexigens]|nr:peptidoglycan editing factor PgeF [Desulfocapsa sulfexigens]